MTHNEKLAYTAGLIDGEGYIGLMKSNGYKYPTFIPVVKVASCDPYMTVFLHTNFGGNLENRTPKNPMHSDSRAWSIRGAKRVGQFLGAIRPYLIVKHLQADLVLDYSENYTGTGHARMKYNKATNSYDMSPAFIEKRQEYYANIKQLNRRGRAAAETE